MYQCQLNPHDLPKRRFLKRKFGHICLAHRMVQRLGEFEVENTSFLAAFKNSTAFINLFPSALKYSIFMQQIRHNLIHHALRNSSKPSVNKQNIALVRFLLSLYILEMLLSLPGLHRCNICSYIHKNSAISRQI